MPITADSSVGRALQGAATSSASTDIEVTRSGSEIMVVGHPSAPGAASTRLGGDIIVEVRNGKGVVRVDGTSGAAQLWSADPACLPKDQTLSKEIVCDLDDPAEATAFIDLESLDERGAPDRTFEVVGDIDTTFVGSPYADAFFGGEGDDYALGQDGADELYGGGGDDEIVGGAGPDLIDVLDDDGSGADVVDCNDEASRGTDNDPLNDDVNEVDYDLDVDKITDCGDAGPGVPAINVYGTNYAGASSDGGFNLVALFPLAGLVEASLTAEREGNALVISDDLGDRSLTFEEGLGTVDCKGEEPTSPFSSVRCSFPASSAKTEWTLRGDFADAKGPVALSVASGSSVRATFTGSAHDDSFKGGDLDDYARGMAGDDVLSGGAGVDTLYGEEGSDTLVGDAGNDHLGGGLQDDTLLPGTGVDTVVGGLGNDSVSSKDREKDTIDCGKPDARDPKEVNTIVEYDAGTDVLVQCGVTEVPTNELPPTIEAWDVKVGERIFANIGTWRGTAPLKYDYQWYSCPAFSDPVIDSRCKRLRVGTLDAKGLEPAGPAKGQQPSYVPVRADTGTVLRFLVRASNSDVRGGGTATALASMGTEVGPPPSLTIDGARWLPASNRGSWTFGRYDQFDSLVRASKIAPYTEIIPEPVALTKFPRPMRNAIMLENGRAQNPVTGQILGVTINGQALSATTPARVEATFAEQAIIKVRYYSPLEDRATCPVSDADIAGINRSISAGASYSLPAFTAVINSLKNSDGGTCPWRVEWSSTVATRPFHEVQGVRIEQDPDSDEPTRLVLTVRQPNVSAGLSLVVGPPPGDHVTANPRQFTIHPSLRLVAFPNGAETSMMVGLVGDQVRQGAKFARAEVFINGRLRSTRDFAIATSDGRVPYSVIITERLVETGAMRVVVSTYAGEPTGLSVPLVGQVFADLDIINSEQLGAELGTGFAAAATIDGRCFTFDGEPAACEDIRGWTLGPELSVMKDILLTSYKSQLANMRLWRGIDVVRRASVELGRTFTVMVANSNIKDKLPRKRSVSPRYQQCVDWSVNFIGALWCHGANLVEGIGNAVIGPPKTATVKKPARPKIRIKIVYIGPGRPGLAIYGDGYLNVAGHLLNLDGGSLLNLDGGSLLNLDGGSLADLVKQGLINLDGGSLLNLEGGTLIGLDGNGLVSPSGSPLVTPQGQIAIPLIKGPGI